MIKVKNSPNLPDWVPNLGDFKNFRTSTNPILVKVRRFGYGNMFVYFFLILISYQFVYPLLRMVSFTLMSPEDVVNPAVNWIPQDWNFENLRIGWRVMEPIRTIFHSTWFSGLLAIGSTIVAATTGYAFARFEFPLKKLWFALIIIAFILPRPVVIIPQTMMAINITGATGFRLIGTPWPQIAMAFMGQGVFSTILILIFYNFIKMIPGALDEAASIDGASSLQIFYHIVLKLSLTTILVVFIFSFVWNWNETYVTGVFLRGNLPLVPERLENFATYFERLEDVTMDIGAGDYVDPIALRLNEALRMSGTLISMFPLFILYMCVQKQFIKGIENTGLTGI